MYNCFFIKNNIPIFVQPNSGLYGKEIDLYICKDFFKHFKEMPSETIFVKFFLKPLNTEIKDFESLKVIAQVYGLSDDLVDKITAFKSLWITIILNLCLESFETKSTKKDNFWFAFLQGKHCAKTAWSILDQMTLTWNKIPKNQKFQVKKNKSFDFF